METENKFALSVVGQTERKGNMKNVVLVGGIGALALECSLDMENGKLFSDGIANGFVSIGDEEIIFEDSVKKLLGEEYDGFISAAKAENKGTDYPFAIELNRDEDGYYATIVCGNVMWGLDIYEEE